MGLGNTFQTFYLTPQHLLPPIGYRFTSIAGGPFGQDFALATVAPVPEPSTLLLAAMAVLGLLGARRGRRRSTSHDQH